MIYFIHLKLETEKEKENKTKKHKIREKKPDSIPNEKYILIIFHNLLKKRKKV